MVGVKAGLEKRINLAFTTKGINSSITNINKLNNTLRSIKRPAQSITDVLNKSLKKRGNFLSEMDVFAARTAPRTASGFDAMSNAARKALNKMQTGFKGVNKQMRGFDLNALGIMFFGMAIQRVFLGIAKASTEMFNKIMESSEAGATNVQILGTMFDFLKFKIGSAINTAIGPLIPKIFEITNKIASWISKNSELVAKIIAVGLAVGTFLLLAGTLKLGIAAVSGTVGKLILKLGDIPGVLPGVGIAIAAALVLWESDFGGFRDFVEDIFGGFAEFVKETGPDIKDAFSGILEAVTGFFEGDMDKMENGLRKFGGNVIKIFVKIAFLIASLFINLVQLINNLFIDLFMNIIPNFVDWILTKILTGFNKISNFLGLGDIVNATEFKEVMGVGKIEEPELIDWGVNKDALSAAMKEADTIIDQFIDVNITVEGDMTTEVGDAVAEQIAEKYGESARVYGASGTF